MEERVGTERREDSEWTEAVEEDGIILWRVADLLGPSIETQC